MGSTIVMLMEVSNKAEILVKKGDSVKYGQPIIINN